MSRNSAWVPNQHGAWAMMSVPAVAAMLRSDVTWAHLPLIVCWFAGYFAFFAAGQWLRAPERRRAPYRKPILTYAAVSTLAGVVLLVIRPDLVIWAVPYLPLAAISLGYSSRRDDRSLVNDAVTILAACLFALVTYHAGHSSLAATVDDPGWPSMLAVFVALLAYFLGTSLYVKTLIRERRSRGYHLASVGYHATWTIAWAVATILATSGVLPGLATALGGGSPTGWVITAFFVVLTVRAAVLAGRAIRPMKVGLGEIAACIILLVIVATWPADADQGSPAQSSATAQAVAVAYPSR